MLNMATWTTSNTLSTDVVANIMLDLNQQLNSRPAQKVSEDLNRTLFVLPRGGLWVVTTIFLGHPEPFREKVEAEKFAYEVGKQVGYLIQIVNEDGTLTKIDPEDDMELSAEIVTELQKRATQPSERQNVRDILTELEADD